MDRGVLVWLLSVRLLARDIWLADGHAGNRAVPGSENKRDALWSHPLVQAYWQAERAQWAEEEAQQDAAWFGAREELPVDEVLGPEPAPRAAPDLDERDQTRSLAEGYPDRYRPPARLPVRTRMGPRPEDIFVWWWSD